MWPVVLGLGAGILMAIATTRLMTGLLFEVRALDAATFVSAPLVGGAAIAVGDRACTGLAAPGLSVSFSVAHLAGGWPSRRAWTGGCDCGRALFGWVPQISLRLFLPAWSTEGPCCFLGLAACAGAVERGSSREGDVEPAIQLRLHGRAARHDCVRGSWRTAASAKLMERLVFEEEYRPELLALGLDGTKSGRR